MEHCDHDTIRREVKGRLELTALKLKSYSGEALPIVKQARVQLSWESYSITTCVQVQMNAPIHFLLGTDLQSSLGLRIVDLGDPEQIQSCRSRASFTGDQGAACPRQSLARSYNPPHSYSSTTPSCESASSAR